MKFILCKQIHACYLNTIPNISKLFKQWMNNQTNKYFETLFLSFSEDLGKDIVGNITCLESV